MGWDGMGKRGRERKEDGGGEEGEEGREGDKERGREGDREGEGKREERGIEKRDWWVVGMMTLGLGKENGRSLERTKRTPCTERGIERGSNGRRGANEVH